MADTKVTQMQQKIAALTKELETLTAAVTEGTTPKRRRRRVKPDTGGPHGMPPAGAPASEKGAFLRQRAAELRQQGRHREATAAFLTALQHEQSGR